MKKQEQGFSAIEVIIILVIAGIIGFAGWFVYNRSQSKETSNTASPSTATSATATTAPVAVDPYADWQAYTMTSTDISFKYPKAWTATTSSSSSIKELVILTAPDKSEIRLNVSKFLGGFTGDEPTRTIEDVVEGTNTTTAKTYAGLTYKTDEGKYVSSNAALTTAGKYKVGDSIQQTPQLMTIKDKGGASTNLTVTVSGAGDENFGKSETYASLAGIKNLDTYKSLKQFLEALEIKSF